MDASPWSFLVRLNGRRKTINFDACFLTEAFRLQSDRSNIEKQIIHFENLKRNKPEPVSHSAILNALSKLSDGFKGMPVAARLRLIKGVIAGIRINKDYTLTMQVKNPNLLDFKEEKESVITGAIGSPTYKNGSGGGTKTTNPNWP